MIVASLGAVGRSLRHAQNGPKPADGALIVKIFPGQKWIGRRVGPWSHAERFGNLAVLVLSLTLLLLLKGTEARNIQARYFCNLPEEPCPRIPLVDLHIVTEQSFQVVIAVLVASCLVARGGRRWVCMLPFASLIFGPVAFGEPPLALFGGGWMQPWKGGIIELVLLCLPVAVVAHQSKRLRPMTGAERTAVLFVVLLAIIAAKAWSFLVRQDPTSLTVLAAIFLLGLSVPDRHRDRWILLLLPVLFARLHLGTNVWPGAAGIAVFLVLSGPLLLGMAAQPLARLFATIERRPTGLLPAVNGLNITDATLTALAVRSGSAIEANPLVRWAGLPLKIMVVLIASTAVARRKPDALLVPCAILAAVLAYHLVGLLVFS